MARHTITFKEIHDWLHEDSWRTAASCFGKGSNKRLEVDSKTIFRVTTNDKVTYQGRSLETAIEAYNEAP